MASLTLEQLTAVCDEIAAVSRAGLPLDRGLREAALEIRGRAALLTAELGDRLAAGEPLEKLLFENHKAIPPAFRAVLEAGVRSGNLPQAVDAVSRSAKLLAEMRHSVRVAWIYPYFLLVTAYLLLWMMLFTLPVMFYFFRQFEVPLTWWEQGIVWALDRQGYWYPVLGLFLVLWMAWDWWQLSAGDELFKRRWSLRLFGTGWHRAQQLSQQGAFCELLALLLKNQVTLPSALRLAAEGSFPRRMQQAIETTCQQLELGNPRAIEQSELSALIQCVLHSGGNSDVTVSRLERLSKYFRAEATARIAWASIRLPMILALVVGGSLIFLYVSLFWVPWLRIIHRLLEPTFR